MEGGGHRTTHIYPVWRWSGLFVRCWSGLRHQRTAGRRALRPTLFSQLDSSRLSDVHIKLLSYIFKRTSLQVAVLLHVYPSIIAIRGEGVRAVARVLPLQILQLCCSQRHHRECAGSARMLKCEWSWTIEQMAAQWTALMRADRYFYSVCMSQFDL